MLNRPGEGPFAAFKYVDQPGGVDAYYAQVATEAAAGQAQEVMPAVLTEAKVQRYQESGIDTDRLFAEDIAGLAAEEGMTYYAFTLKALGVGAEWQRNERGKSRELARRLGFSEDVVQDPATRVEPEKSELMSGIAGYGRPRKSYSLTRVG